MELTRKQKGILLMLLSTFLLCAMQVVVSMMNSNIGVMEQVFFRNFISLFVAFYFIKKNKLPMFGERKYQPALFARSLFGFLGIILLFYASRHAFQADVTILSKIAPFLITVFSVFFLNEKISKMQVPALFIAFAGAYLAANPSFDSNFLPLGCALAAAVCNSICYTLLGFFKEKVNAMTVIMHFSTFSMAASIPFMMGSFVIPTMRELIMLLLIGFFGSFGQITLTYSYRMVAASEVSIYNQAGILYSIVLGFIFLGEKPASSSLIGGSLVMLASLLVYFYNTHEEKKELLKKAAVET